MADVALELPGRAHQIAHLRVARHGVAQARLFFHRVVEGDLEFVGNQLRDAVHLAVGHIHHAAHVAQDALRQHAPEGDDLAHVLAPVFLLHVADDLVAPVHAEVDVHVGRTDALGVQEAFEEKGVPERVDARDAQRVGGQAARRRAPARPHGDVLLLGVANEVGDDEEVTLVVLAVDDFELHPEPLAVALGFGALDTELRELGREPLLGGAPQVFFLVGPVGGLEIRVVGRAEGELEIALPGDGEGVGEGVWRLAEQRLHLLCAFEIVLFALYRHAVGIGQGLARLDADEHLLGAVISLVEVMHVVGGDEGQAHLFREGDDPRDDLLVLLHPVVL